jgi:NAD/NADP transhydrogenase alpha subunit
VLCVNPPSPESLGQLKPGALLAGLLSPYGATPLVEALNNRQVSALALELLPRISRAQSMMCSPPRPISPATRPCSWRPLLWIVMCRC